MEREREICVIWGQNRHIERRWGDRRYWQAMGGGRICPAIHTQGSIYVANSIARSFDHTLSFSLFLWMLQDRGQGSRKDGSRWHGRRRPARCKLPDCECEWAVRHGSERERNGNDRRRLLGCFSGPKLLLLMGQMPCSPWADSARFSWLAGK